MFLIKISATQIHNTENAVTYRLDNDEYTPVRLEVVGANASLSGEAPGICGHIVAVGENATRFWDYLCKQVYEDFSKPVDETATSGTETTARAFIFKLGDRVRVNKPDDKNHNEVGTVTYITNADNAAQPYEVTFSLIESGDEWDETEWYAESELLASVASEI